jgi:hypothetical protein
VTQSPSDFPVDAPTDVSDAPAVSDQGTAPPPSPDDDALTDDDAVTSDTATTSDTRG